MNNWVTIATFNYAHQAALLKGRIESEGLLCNIKDELIVNTNPLYSNAIGGVKVQVRDCDVQNVIPLLKELGYNVEADASFEKLVTKVVRFTQKIPVINKYSLERRYTLLMLAASLFLAAILVVVYYSSK
ncbi:MAG TPA: hypothetical protein VK783_09290 [Bacteroidia bacterium]|jgi:hypothetical protein|nr:hypothetical protein [Bacteroidia bacterium]